MRPANVSKLTDAQKWEVTRRYVAGEPLKDIAAAYGVSMNTVSYTARAKGFRKNKKVRWDAGASKGE